MAPSVCWNSIISQYVGAVVTYLHSIEDRERGVYSLDHLVDQIFVSKLPGSQKWKLGKLKVRTAGIDQLLRFNEAVLLSPLHSKVATYLPKPEHAALATILLLASESILHVCLPVAVSGELCAMSHDTPFSPELRMEVDKLRDQIEIHIKGLERSSQRMLYHPRS